MKNNKKIEKKIIDSIYEFEKKRTALAIFKYIFLIAFSLFLFLNLVSIIVLILKEQQTFDVFEIFNEDIEIIKTYFFDVLELFYLELPKFLTFSAFLSLFLLIASFYFLKKNFSKIKNRLFSLKKHFK